MGICQMRARMRLRQGKIQWKYQRTSEKYKGGNREYSGEWTRGTIAGNGTGNQNHKRDRKRGGLLCRPEAGLETGIPSITPRPERPEPPPAALFFHAV